MNSIVKALATPLIRFIIYPIFEGSTAKIEKKAPSIWYNGAPGGWPISNLDEVEMYSPASQKLAVGSTVKLYEMSAMAKAHHPTILVYFGKLKFVIRQI